ncbi:FtsW/RodA/SpoVE family cell cycle protein [Oceanobacillus iheyensis]|uniref:Cell-division protein n=1 Tax=Oceanobacillus iheyensis (strain DSM 14371 / CIP 107618 / JCM 11309 / KCTC 3954 / HTE831) TaxID=221109 RepID=Q8ESI5_OCEIH|nr:FtsW/RodA/SpoVE family cell cycle protein [Oceanobacillus iheyensis]BAC12605.1 cell-division protein [Oceanobacillus iheyensis HTE831]
MNKKQNYYFQTDLILLFLGFVIISLLAIYNAQQIDQANTNFVIRQIAFFSIGVCFVAAIQFIDLEQLYRGSIYIYIGGVLLLGLLLISPDAIAREINGANSWFTLPGLSIQPAEFAKMSTILFLAATITGHKEKTEVQTMKTDIMLLLKLIIYTMIPVGLIMLQPDFGTSMVYLFIAGMMIILSGINWRIIVSLIVGLVSLAGAAIGAIIRFPQFAIDVLGVAPYQVDRIMTWFDPSQQSADATFQFERSHMSLGSGQLFGKGMSSLEVQYPEAHTDFIFSVIGESFGFIGSAIVIFLYFMLLYRLVTLGLSIYKHSPFGTYFCFGFLSLMLVHVFQNIGMTIGIMPITGIPLLLISYGGSSVMSTMLGLAVVYRVAVEHTIQNDYLFK